MDLLVPFLIVSSLNKEGWMITIINVVQVSLYTRGLSLSSPCTHTMQNEHVVRSQKKLNSKKQNISNIDFTEHFVQWGMEFTLYTLKQNWLIHFYLCVFPISFSKYYKLHLLFSPLIPYTMFKIPSIITHNLAVTSVLKSHIAKTLPRSFVMWLYPS